MAAALPVFPRPKSSAYLRLEHPLKELERLINILRSDLLKTPTRISSP
jgi:hypothetical protein